MECKKKGCKNLAYDGKYCNYHQAEIEDRNKKIRSVGYGYWSCYDWISKEKVFWRF